jgi:2,3-bisphosphoglycerate-dependent phosphoglycerate mutase
VNLNDFPHQITLLRHGESIGNAAGYHQGQSDFELNDTGRAQAQALANRWRAEGRIFDQIVSSPLARAQETAEIIAAALNAPIDLDPIWMERDNGKYAGLHPSEAQRLYPRPVFSSIYDPVGVTGESQWELYLRAGRAVQDLLKRPSGRYLVVSHGGLLNMVMYCILGIVPQANFHGARFRFRNTAFAVLYYNPGTHSWVLDRLNDCEHWKGNQED